MHAVSIVGFGIAKNIQYDNNKFGDVPYWHCRNSWGTKWGDKGFFKIAMYPFNKKSQFDKQVMTDIGGPIGSLFLVRATKSPKVADLSQIKQIYFNKINRLNSDNYYKAGPEEVRLINRANLLNLEDLKKKDNAKRLKDEIEELERGKTRAVKGAESEKEKNKIWWIIVFAAIVFLMTGIYIYEKRY